MLTRFDRLRCPAILSVREIHPERRRALVVTPSPTLARAIGDHLRMLDDTLSVIWLPTLSSVRRRLETDEPAIVVIDETLPASVEFMESIHAASPATNIVALGGGR